MVCRCPPHTYNFPSFPAATSPILSILPGLQPSPVIWFCFYAAAFFQTRKLNTWRISPAGEARLVQTQTMVSSSEAQATPPVPHPQMAAAHSITAYPSLRAWEETSVGCTFDSLFPSHTSLRGPGTAGSEIIVPEVFRDLQQWACYFSLERCCLKEPPQVLMFKTRPRLQVSILWQFCPYSLPRLYFPKQLGALPTPI